MKTDLIKQFNLPPYIKGKSFAQASIAIENKFRDRKDKYSNDTKEELMQRLADAQEYVKMQESLQNESQQIPDQMNGEVPQGMEQFMQQGQGQEMMQPQQGMEQMPPEMMQQQDGQQMAYGGNINKYNIGGAFGLEGLSDDATMGDKFKAVGGSNTAMAIGSLAGKIGAAQSKTGDPLVGAGADTLKTLGASDPSGITGGIGTAIGFANKAFGPTNIDTSGATRSTRVKGGVQAGGMGLEGAVAGAKIGGPVGAGIGAVLGVGAGLFGASKANKDIEEANHQYVLGQNAGLRQSDFAYGGSVNKFGNGTPFIPNLDLDNKLNDLTNEKTLDTISQSDLDFLKTNKNIQNSLNSTVSKDLPFINNRGFDTRLGDNGGENKTLVGRGLDFMGKNAGRAAEFAPVVSNILALKNLKRATTARGSRLDNVYQKQQFDEARALNQLRQQNIPRALTEASGGDAGALRSSLLGADVNYKKALSDTMGAQGQRDISENQFKYQADAQKDQTNVMLDQEFINRQAQDEGAYQSTKSKFQRQIADDIAGIGREAGNKDLVKEMFGYKWDGEYYVDKNGIRHSREEVNKKVTEKKAQDNKTSSTTSNDRMFGGYTLKRK